MSENLMLRKLVSHPYFSMIFCLSVWFVLPHYGGRYGGIAVMIACASLLSVHVAVLPELYRGRNGTLTAAICLVATMWAGTAMVTALILMGVAY